MTEAVPLTPAPTRRGRRRLVLFALLAVAAYAAFVVMADAEALAAALARLDLAALALALLLTVLVYVIRSLRWRLYLGELDVLKPTGPLGFAPAFAMGVPQGKWGQVVKAWALRSRAGLSYHRSLPAVFAERVSEVVGGVLHLAVGLAIVPGGSIRMLLIALAVLAVAMALMRSESVVHAIVRAASRIPWVGRHEAAIREGHGRLRGHLSLRALAAPSTMALAAFLVESLALWAIATPGLGLQLSVAEAILMVAIMDVAATVTFIPGGLVAAEGSLIVLLALSGIPLAEATATTLLFRAVTLWFGIGLGVLAVGALRAMPSMRRGVPAQA